MLLANVVMKLVSKFLNCLNMKLSVPIWIMILQIICVVFMVTAHKSMINREDKAKLVLEEQKRAIRFKEFYITNFINITNKLADDYSLDQKDIIVLSNSTMRGKYD